MAEILRERGFFWWFNDPDRPANSEEASIPGLLTITDDGQVSLETEGALCLAGECSDWTRPRTFPESKRIAGWLASSSKYVLLEKLERVDFSFADRSPQQQKFLAELCTQRESPSTFPSTYKHENFVELRVELAGFEEWLELDSIVVSHESSGGDDEIHVRVSYKQTAFKYSTLGGSISIESFTTGAGFPGLASRYPRRDAQFKQAYYLVFRPDSPSDLPGLRYIHTRLEELFAILTGSYCRLPWPTFVRNEEPFDAWDTVYFYRGAPGPTSVNRYSVWIPFKQISKCCGELFRNFLNKSETFGAGYYLYVSALRNPHYYAEHRFVNLIWSTEALHRKWLAEPEFSERIQGERERVERILDLLPAGGRDQKWLRGKLKYAHELSIEVRILECFRKLPVVFGKGELEKFAKVCADRRNDISHTGGPRSGVDYDSFQNEISCLAEALDCLFHALLLYQMGVDDATLLKVMTDSMVSERIKVTLANANLHIRQSISTN